MSTLQGPHALHPRLAAAVGAAALLLLACLSPPASAQSCGLVYGDDWAFRATANSPALAMAYEPAFREFIDDFQPMALERDGVPANAMPQRARDEAAIRDVVEAFRTAIIRKDKAAFMALFHSDDPARVTWQFVVDDARLARVQKAKPEARKARYIAASNHVNFIDGIVAEPAAEEEVFKDVVVDTDGEVGSVAFDYAYLSAGKETNHGREMWQLVRTEAGWKIIAVIFSVRDP